MKAKDLRERPTDDLVELRKTMQKDMFSYRMKNFTNQLEDTSLLGKVRKDLARIEQILHERKLKASASEGTES
ncbi:MAG TPA: 50S ribosomal protein L29 [Polyangiaceae bacterium]